MNTENTVQIEPSIMNAQEVAAYLGVHEMTFYRWCKQGILPAFKIGGRWRVQRATLDAFMKSKEITNGQ